MGLDGLMSDLQSAVEWPGDFCGRVRLFPLPNLVLFPHVTQALHIFEPRYCEMLGDSMATDRLIAMALLEPGWEAQYHKKPPIASVVCIGKVIAHTPTVDHRHNICSPGCGERASFARSKAVNAATGKRMWNCSQIFIRAIASCSARTLRSCCSTCMSNLIPIASSIHNGRSVFKPIDHLWLATAVARQAAIARRGQRRYSLPHLVALLERAVAPSRVARSQRRLPAEILEQLI